MLAGLWGTRSTQVVTVSFANSGFETFPTGGPGDWEWPNGGDWIWDSVAYGGAHSARVSRSSGSATDQLWSPRVSVQPSTVCTLTYWLRLQNATASPVVNIYQYTSAGAQTGPRLRSRMDVGDGARDWFQVGFRFQTMPDANYMRVALFLWTGTTGTFWFDDFDLDQGPLAPYPLQDGFPVAASYQTINLASPAVADIDNDGDNELLVGNGGGKIDGWDAGGAVLPNFPLATGDKRISGQLALADLDGDGDLEIVAGTKTPLSGGQARVFIWHHTGATLRGWPQSVAWLGQYGTEISEVCSVALADIDGDGDLEVLAGTTNGAPNYYGTPDCSGADVPVTPNLYAWHADGTLVAGEWPTWHSGSAIYGAIAVGDLTGDGTADVITCRDHHYLHAYAGSGSPLPGWPISTYLGANGGNLSTDIRIVHFDSDPVIADLDGDGTSEYIVTGNVKYPGENLIRNSGLLVLNADGTRRPGWETAALGNGILWSEVLPQKAPAVADLDQDGQLEIVIATYDGWIRAYKPDQRVLWAFDYAQGDTLFASEPVIGDIDGDQSLEIIFGTYDPVQGDGSVGLWSLEADGTPITGFPLAVGTPGIRAAPTLADLDGDGDLEILAAAWNGEIFVWDAPASYAPSRLPWPTGRHDLRRSATFVQPRPDLSASSKFATLPTPRQGETVAFVIRLHNIGSRPFTHTLRLTDTVPSGLTYVPSSLAAPLGVFTDEGGSLRWSGVLSNTPMIDITYAVTVTTGATELITNTVTIDTVTDGLITRTGYVFANGWLFYLPLVAK